MMTTVCTVYIAGPEVFLADAVEIGLRKKQLCGKYGFRGLFPFDKEDDLGSTGERSDHIIFRANVDMIRRCDLGICNLTPFRGVSADVGTVFELGMLAGLGKRVFGYSNDTEGYLERNQHAGDASKVGGVWRVRLGMVIEEFGNADNLMIDACLTDQGHPLVRVDTRKEDRYRDLSGFEACLEMARNEFSLHMHRRA